MIKHISLSLVDANHAQPRKVFHMQKIKALGMSIKKEGLLQPIVVRPHPNKEGRYELASGECRVRGARMMKIKSLRADVRDLTDDEMRRFALLENLARTNMNEIDVSNGIKALLDSGVTLASAAKTVGRTKRYLEEGQLLLRLPPEIQGEIIAGRLVRVVAIEIARLPRHLHMQAFKATRGRHQQGALHRIRILAMAAREQELFSLTAESCNGAEECLKIWNQFQSAAGRLITAHVERRESVLSALSRKGSSVSELDLIVKSLKKIRSEAGLLLTYIAIREENTIEDQQKDARTSPRKLKAGV